MKSFIVGLTKVFPWIYMICGMIALFSNPPRRGPAFGDYKGDEDAVMCIVLFAGIIITTLLLVGFSYVVEAACKYLEKCESEKMISSEK